MADPAGRIVTAGGTTSWHDLAIHIISRHCGPGEALRIAKVYLLKLHGEGQLPFASLVRRQPHADSTVRHAEAWLADNFRETHAVAGAVAWHQKNCLYEVCLMVVFLIKPSKLSSFSKKLKNFNQRRNIFLIKITVLEKDVNGLESRIWD